MSKKLTPAFVKTMYQRQKSLSWDESYQAAIQATKEEAPPHSKPSQPYYKKFNRRIHLLSEPEQKICIFGLFNKNVVGVQEQRLLSPIATPHPLWTHPNADRLNLPSLSGVIEVSNELGLEKHLERISVKNKSGESLSVQIPLVGDLLFAIQIKCLLLRMHY